MSKRNFRVFVVEDHLATARGLKMFLELSGYQVEIATTVAAALEIAETARFDVLVCDLNLPDGTGWQLMDRLRRSGPVHGIAFSAFDEPEHVERSKEAGFEQHVVKGTTPEALLAAIDKLANFVPPKDPLSERVARAARRPSAKTPRASAAAGKRSAKRPSGGKSAAKSKSKSKRAAR